MKLVDDWKNGDSKAQIIGVSYGDTSFLEYSPKLVKIGSWEHEIEVTVPVAGKLDVSQAEFFYDCNKQWHSDACKNGDPMWHFRWRARLRRFDASGNDNLAQIAGIALGAEAYVSAVEEFSPDTLTLKNVDLYPKLLEAAQDPIVH
jgi:hypothetical protein